MDDFDVDEMKIALLFRAVIRQAAKDAFGISSTSAPTRFEKDKARLFLSGNKDLKTVCEIAEVNRKEIVDIMKSTIDEKEKYKKINEVLL